MTRVFAIVALALGASPAFGEIAMDRMELISSAWKDTSGGMALFDFTLKNDNDYEVKDIRIQCSFTGKSGTSLKPDTDHTIYDVIPAKSRRTFSRVNIGTVHPQANGARCYLYWALKK